MRTQQILYMTCKFIALILILQLILSCSSDSSSNFKIVKLCYQLNNKQKMEALPGTNINFSKDDTLSFSWLEFEADFTSSKGTWAECYLVSSQSNEIEKNQGQFTYGSKEVVIGKNLLNFKPGSWILQENDDRFTINLIFQYGNEDHEFKKVSSTFINLNCIK